MEEVLVQTQLTATEKGSSVVLDIESLVQSSTDRCTGSPKMTKALSRKGSSRMERRNGEDLEADEPSKKFVVKVVCPQLEHLKQPSASTKSLMAVSTSSNTATLADCGDARSKKFCRLGAVHPRKILLLFASMSSMGTMILIYFTLALNRRGGV